MDQFLPTLLGAMVGGGIVLFGNYLTSKYQANLWERQMVWTEKRKLYGQLLKAIKNGRNAFISLDLRSGWKATSMDMAGCVQRISTVYDELDDLWPSLLIFGGPELQEAHAAFLMARERKPLKEPEPEWCQSETDAFSRYQAEVVNCAQIDLSIKRGMQGA